MEGQRREWNVLKRLRVSGELLILLGKYVDFCSIDCQRKMKTETNTYSGLTDLLFAQFSLCCPEFGPMLMKNIG